MADWLKDFVRYGSSGPISERMAYWVGVSTIASVLQRKVFIDYRPHYEWSPNFYILLVGPTGAMKGTAMGYGLQLLKQIEGVHIGPSGVTWQALIQHIAEQKEEVVFEDGEVFESSCITLAPKEFGVFFDPMNRELRDNLTSLWDAPRETVTKMTKGSGTDDMVNPWINLISATTPGWLCANFTESMIRDGFANRIIYLFENAPPAEKDDMFPPDISHMEAPLLQGLRWMVGLAGEMRWSDEAKEFVAHWFKQVKEEERQMGSKSLEAAFVTRKPTHMGKLAMVIAVSQNSFPVIQLSHVKEAIARLDELKGDMTRAMGSVGQTKITSASREIAEAVHRYGSAGIERRRLYNEMFWRTMTANEFKEAVDSAIQAEEIMEADGVAHPILMPR